jgi:Holliday junction DNA helicase RuvA
MIASLRGSLIAKSPTEIHVDVQGVGFSLAIPLSTYEKLGDLRSDVFLHTHLHVRDDALQLFGFITVEERAMFRLLLGVTGIGPKMALGILSGIPVIELRRHLASGNLSALTAIPGIGRKLAERLVLELREKITRAEVGGEVPAGPPDDHTRIRQEAIMALMSLGFARPAADRALHAALQTPEGTNAPLETLIKLALRHAAKTS